MQVIQDMTGYPQQELYLPQALLSLQLHLSNSWLFPQQKADGYPTQPDKYKHSEGSGSVFWKGPPEACRSRLL